MVPWVLGISTTAVWVNSRQRWCGSGGDRRRSGARRLFFLISASVALNFGLLVAPLFLVYGFSEAQGDAQVGKHNAGDAARSNRSKRGPLQILC